MENLKLTREENVVKKEDNNFSPELNEKVKEFKEGFESIKGDLRNLVNSFAEVKIPRNRFDKSRMDMGNGNGNGNENENENVLADSGLLGQSNELNLYIDNLENGDWNDIKSISSNFFKIKDKLNYFNNRFNLLGYLEDRNKGGDVLRKDFPEIATQIDSLMTKIPELNRHEVSMKNKFNAYNKFQEFKNGSNKREKWIPEINHISTDGEHTMWNSAEIGFCYTPEELSFNLEKFIKEEIQEKSMNKIDLAENLTEEDKNKRKESLNSFIVGAKEYLNEFNNLIKRNKTN